ncbi:chromosome segregation DNA-binding protein [Thalassobaculum fulvum]|uniref:Chromosome segregation DNA-binding protein n=1 Tax=Thalassobaculum fulvum TaxID=1633335 RepID=A0A918XMI4_9PROT|nr:ParB/RepB/Spo0J family partition protein [Thalassobaculum fulvum]GHD39657.1 chromosome segregation DNA-binding protein [Thalassobaculum fulvum]
MTDDSTRRRSNKLGRGLSALLGDEEEDQAQLDRLRQTRSLPVERLAPGPFQPRRRFDAEDLSELAESIREQGVLQPVLVRRAADGETYEIIAGERRWRAAQLAQLHEIPVLVREFDDRTAMEIALVENVQRRDLTALEEADGYHRLIAEYGHSQEDIARAVGKSRSHVANTLRLLNLPTEVRALLEDGQLTAGHARALLGQDDAAELAREVVTRKLNVRDTEKLVQRRRMEPSAPRPRKPRGQGGGQAADKDPDTLAVERDLGDRLGLAVSIDHDAGSGGGSVTVRYSDLDQLDLVIERLSGISTGSAVAAPAAEEDDEGPPRWSFDDDEEDVSGVDLEDSETAAADEPGEGSALDRAWAQLGDDEEDEDPDDPLVPKAE